MDMGMCSLSEKHASAFDFSFLLGLREERTKLLLLKEDNLSPDKAINMCRSREVATQQSTNAHKTSVIRVLTPDLKKLNNNKTQQLHTNAITVEVKADIS